jgi:hypothetical protein
MVLKFLSLALAMSCGVSEDYVPYKMVPRVSGDFPKVEADLEATMLVRQFYADGQSLQKSVAMDVTRVYFVDSFDEENSRVIGRCLIYGFEDGSTSHKEVEILKPFWDKASWTSKRTLVYHELGHCALELDHTAPQSGAIMQPTMIFDDHAADNWFDLVTEEFNSSILGLNSSQSDDDCVVHITTR